MQIRHTKNMRAATVTKFGGPEVLELTEMQIAKRIPLENVQRAHRLLENQEVLGKLILMND